MVNSRLLHLTPPEEVGLRKQQQIDAFSFIFIDLTVGRSAFDRGSMVSRREDLPKVLPKIGCQHKLQRIIDQSFHTDVNGTGQFNGSSSELFHIRSSVKQDCFLAVVLYGVFFALLLKNAFDAATEAIYCVPDHMTCSSAPPDSEPSTRGSETCC